MRRIVTGAAAMALAAALTGPAGPVRAADGGTVTLAGPQRTDTMMLTYLPCAGFFGGATPPASRINLGPGVAPLGQRSVGLVPRGRGTAAGPFVRFSSLAQARPAVSAFAAQGSTGAAYVWVSTLDAPLGRAWLGRADLSVPAGGWHRVAVADLTFTWQLRDLGSGAAVGDAEESDAASFAEEHGAGAGYAVIGLGCDGAPVNLDAVTDGSTTWNFEGVVLTTSAALSRPTVDAGQSVVVSGTVRNPAGEATGDRLELQARRPGETTWRTVESGVLADPDGTARVEVHPDETTELRWHRPEGQYADEGWSDVVRVEVRTHEGAAGDAAAQAGQPSAAAQ